MERQVESRGTKVRNVVCHTRGAVNHEASAQGRNREKKEDEKKEDARVMVIFERKEEVESALRNGG